MKKLLLTLLLLLNLAPLAGWADDIFISNKPFKGQSYGVGTEIRFSVLDLAKALNLTTSESAEGWLLDGRQVKTTKEHDVIWISLADLPPELVRVVRNKEFGTIDLYRVEGASAPTQGTWGGDGTLVIFGASWCPTTASMRPTISEIERSQIVRVVYVDVEAMDSSSYQEFDYLFAGDKIPYFVLLDGHGTKIHSFMGFQTYSDMLAILKKHIKKS